MSEVARIDRCNHCGLTFDQWTKAPRCANHPSGVHLSSSSAGGVVMIPSPPATDKRERVDLSHRRLRIIEGGSDAA